MPNLNLRGGDTPEETPDFQEINDIESAPAPSESPLRRVIPLLAGGAAALVLAFYILNKIGIINLWGGKTPASVTIVSAPSDSAQVLSDSAMAEQFRRDSLQAVAQRSGKKKGGQPAVKKSAVQKNIRDVAQANTRATASEKSTPSAAEKQAPASAPKKQPAAVADPTAQSKTTAKQAAASPERSMTTVEVPGAARRRASTQEQTLADQRSHETVNASRAAASGADAKKEPAHPSVAASKQTAPKKSAPKQAASQLPAGEGTYTVQLSSWMSLAKAQQLASRFSNAGVPAFVYTEGHVHRVCTGRFATQDAATARAEELVPMLESKYDIIIVK